MMEEERKKEEWEERIRRRKTRKRRRRSMSNMYENADEKENGKQMAIRKKQGRGNVRGGLGRRGGGGLGGRGDRPNRCSRGIDRGRKKMKKRKEGRKKVDMK